MRRFLARASGVLAAVNGLVFAFAGSSKAVGVNFLHFSEVAAHRCGTQNTQVPVVFDLPQLDHLFIVGMAFYSNVNIRFFVKHGCQLLQKPFFRGHR